MAKTYINSVKYMIKISFEVSGAVDKPDIVGAVFGQSEGLLGEEMDLKELQKNGKIGRIEINHQNVLGKTRGEIFVPSSMDMVQTSLLAAAIESVDKVGPYDSKFKILTIDDVRTAKREEIKSRAQAILEQFKAKLAPDTTELAESIREGSRTAELTFFGSEKLPAGPEVATSNEIIVVEGRADVINLLKNSIKNAIAMNGSQIPPTILDLSRQKEVTVFVDGDRGGTLIARNFLQFGKAAYIAKAPDGKEVEELARKEIIQSLRKRVSVQEFLSSQSHSTPLMEQSYSQRPQRGFGRGRPQRSRGSFSRGPQRGRTSGPSRFSRGPRRDNFSRRNQFSQDTPNEFSQNNFEPIQPREIEVAPTIQENEKFAPVMSKLKNSLKAKLFDSNMKEIKEVATKDLVDELQKTRGVASIAFDGIITKRLVDAAEKNNVEYVVGAKKGKIGETKVKTLVIKG